MRRGRPGLSSVYGFIVIFLLLMAGLEAISVAISTEGSISAAQDQARQIQSSRQLERLALTLNGTSLEVRNDGLIPSTLSYLYQASASDSVDSRLNETLPAGASATVPITTTMQRFAIVTSLGNVFLSSTDPQTTSGVLVTFDATGPTSSFGSSPVLAVDGAEYNYSQLPKSFEWAQGSVHSYSYAQSFSSASGSRIGWSSARGLASARQGSVTVSQAGGVVSAYSVQYLLSVIGGAAVQFIGSPTGDGWYDSGGTGQFTTSHVWNTTSGSRSNLVSYSLDGSSAVALTRSGSGTYTSLGITMNAPHSITLDSVIQYQLAISGGNGIGYSSSSPTGDGWYDSGTSTTVSSNWVWNVTAGQSRSAITNYAIDGTNLNPAREDSGLLTTSSILMNAAHSISFSSATQYYVTTAANVPSSGNLGALTVSYSYIPTTTVSNALTNPGFESGNLNGWTCDGPCSVVTGPVHSGSYAAEVWNSPSGCGKSGNQPCPTAITQLVSPPSGTYLSYSASVWVYDTGSAPVLLWTIGPCGYNNGIYSTAVNAWQQLSWGWSGSCGNTGTFEFQVGNGNPAYFDDAVMSYTYYASSNPTQGTAPGSPNTFSVSGTAVTYDYGVGYNFPSGSLSTSWSAALPSAETYSSNTCGVSPSGGTISGTGGPCTLVMTTSGTCPITLASPTGDGWYDSGVAVPLSTLPTGAFSFASWNASSNSLVVASAASSSTTLVVDTYGTITADYNVNQ